MESIFYSGSLLELFKSDTKPSSDTALEAQNAIAFLFSCDPFVRKKISKRVLSALFSKRDAELCDAIFFELAQLIIKIYRWLDQGKEVALCETCLARILALIPFLEPPAGKSIAVPRKNGTSYNLITYTTESVALSPLWLGKPLLATILRPQADMGPPFLLFIGTMPPTISGCLLALWTDFVPGFAVGELAFRLFAKRRIAAILRSFQEKAIICGHSLGGAFALLSACEFGDHVAEVHAFGSPALFSRSTKKFIAATKVSLYWYEGDIVPYVGSSFHPKWHHLVVRSERAQSGFFAHVRPVPALLPLSVSEIEPSEARKCYRRKVWTAIHFLVSLPLFPILTVALFLRSVWLTLKNSA
jgi:hypothetical protein